MIDSPYMTVNEAAEYLRVCRRTIERRCEGGVFKIKRDGRRILIVRSSIERSLKSPEKSFGRPRSLFHVE